MQHAAQLFPIDRISASSRRKILRAAFAAAQDDRLFLLVETAPLP
jgi:hypothetical protein